MLIACCTCMCVCQMNNHYAYITGFFIGLWFVSSSQMAFEFIPTAQEVVESLWRFSIPSLSQSFLLVGHTTEPAVLLDRAYINFHSIRLGSTSKETVYLVNNESTEYSFNFVKKSCYSSGHTARVKINPLQGTVKPHSK